MKKTFLETYLSREGYQIFLDSRKAVQDFVLKEAGISGNTFSSVKLFHLRLFAYEDYLIRQHYQMAFFESAQKLVKAGFLTQQKYGKLQIYAVIKTFRSGKGRDNAEAQGTFSTLL